MLKIQQFTNYKDMAEDTGNWKLRCSYQLTTKAHFGVNHFIQLPSMQLSYTRREGGMMEGLSPPKDSFSIAVIQRSNGKACFGNIKLRTGDILFFDDKQFYNFISNVYIEVAIISLPKKHMKQALKMLLTKKLLGHIIHDSQGILSQTLEDILTECLTQTAEAQNENSCFPRAEAEIITLLSELIDTQEVKTPKLTKGEKIVLDIQEQLYKHMDAKICIADLAKEYSVTERTLQNSFNSLFGFTPKHFLQLMKLNHVHHELRESSSTESSVSRIAMKWGFTHMGSFSQYYTDLFGQNPSETLKNVYEEEGIMVDSCADRQEEME